MSIRESILRARPLQISSQVHGFDEKKKKSWWPGLSSKERHFLPGNWRRGFGTGPKNRICPLNPAGASVPAEFTTPSGPFIPRPSPNSPRRRLCVLSCLTSNEHLAFTFLFSLSLLASSTCPIVRPPYRSHLLRYSNDRACILTLPLGTIHTAKHIVNTPKTIVLDSLRGLIYQNPNVRFDEEYKGAPHLLPCLARC